MSFLQQNLGAIDPAKTTLLILGIVLLGLGLVQIVFTVLNGKARHDLNDHVALGVLQIIFGSLPAGILVIIKNKTCRKVSFALSILNCVGFVIAAVAIIVMSIVVTSMS